MNTRQIGKRLAQRLQFEATVKAAVMDVRRLIARSTSRWMLWAYKRRQPLPRRLHFGCGPLRPIGWLNTDLWNSDINIDLGCGRLPFQSGQFDFVCSQHVIEHLHLQKELEPLMREIHRVMSPRGELWLSTPDLEKVCSAYVKDRAHSMELVRKIGMPDYTTGGYPSSQYVNVTFHEEGCHKNLFDLDILCFLLERTGFARVTRVTEAIFLAKFPEFPVHGDDDCTIYVTAIKPEAT